MFRLHMMTEALEGALKKLEGGPSPNLNRFSLQPQSGSLNPLPVRIWNGIPHGAPETVFRRNQSALCQSRSLVHVPGQGQCGQMDFLFIVLQEPAHHFMQQLYSVKKSIADSGRHEMLNGFPLKSPGPVLQGSQDPFRIMNNSGISDGVHVPEGKMGICKCFFFVLQMIQQHTDQFPFLVKQLSVFLGWLCNQHMKINITVEVCLSTGPASHECNTQATCLNGLLNDLLNQWFYHQSIHSVILYGLILGPQVVYDLLCLL